jgi:hypothetical protein
MTEEMTPRERIVTALNHEERARPGTGGPLGELPLEQ